MNYDFGMALLLLLIFYIHAEVGSIFTLMQYSVKNIVTVTIMQPMLWWCYA